MSTDQLQWEDMLGISFEAHQKYVAEVVQTKRGYLLINAYVEM